LQTFRDKSNSIHFNIPKQIGVSKDPYGYNDEPTKRKSEQFDNRCKSADQNHQNIQNIKE
jgi:hypothetical protein